jgi:WD40 repeat protein
LLAAVRGGIERMSLLPRFASFTAPGGPLLRTLSGHGSSVRAVAVTPDGRCAVSASHDDTLKVWDLASGAELRTLAGHGGGVTAVAVTPDGRCAVSASEDDTLKVWELASGEILATLAGDHPMACVATVSNRLLVAGDTGGIVHVLDLVEPHAATTELKQPGRAR